MQNFNLQRMNPEISTLDGYFLILYESGWLINQILVRFVKLLIVSVSWHLKAKKFACTSKDKIRLKITICVE